MGNSKHPLEAEVTEDILNTSISVSSKTALKTHFCPVSVLPLSHHTPPITAAFQNTSLAMARLKKI